MKYSANDNLEIMKCAKNYNNFLVKNILEIIKKYNYEKILDFGCADGFFMEIINKKIQNIEITGIELDDFSFEKCKNKNLNVYKKIDEVTAGYDLIYSFNVLEHIKDDIKILKELLEKLNNKGRLIIYVPAFMFLFSSMDIKTGHFRRYSKKELIFKLNQAGFKIEKINYCDSLGIIATLLYKLQDKFFKNNDGNISKKIITFYDKLFKIVSFADILLFKYFFGKNLLVIATK